MNGIIYLVIAGVLLGISCKVRFPTSLITLAGAVLLWYNFFKYCLEKNIGPGTAILLLPSAVVVFVFSAVTYLVIRLFF